MTERMRKILRGIGIAPKSADELALVAAMQEMAEAVELPSAASLPDGKILKTNSHAWVAGDIDESKYDPYAVTGTIGQDAQEKTTITLNKKASELWAAVSAGRPAKVTYAAGENVSVDMVFFCIGAKIDTNGAVTYSFAMTDYAGTQYTASDFSANDTVVFTAS